MVGPDKDMTRRGRWRAPQSCKPLGPCIREFHRSHKHHRHRHQESGRFPFRRLGPNRFRNSHQRNHNSQDLSRRNCNCKQANQCTPVFHRHCRCRPRHHHWQSPLRCHPRRLNRFRSLRGKCKGRCRNPLSVCCHNCKLHRRCTQAARQRHRLHPNRHRKAPDWIRLGNIHNLLHWEPNKTRRRPSPLKRNCTH